MSQTITFVSPVNCYNGTLGFTYNAGLSPDATGRNVYTQVDLGNGTSNLIIAFNNGANRWEMRANGGNFDVYYINTFASSPNPPSSTNDGSSPWDDFGFCEGTGNATVTGTGTQTTIGNDPCENLGGDSDGDGACDDNDICPGSDDFADSDSDGIPNGCDANPNVADGVLVDAPCLDPDPILFTLSGTDGTGRNVYSTSFANGLTVRYNATLGRWEVRASGGTMQVYLFNSFASWPNPPGTAGTWQGTSVLNCNTAPVPTINGSGTQNTLGCTISIGTPSVTQPPCEGEGIISITATGAKGSITYSLKQGATTLLSNTTGTFTALDAGSYTVVAKDGAFPAGVCEDQTSSILLSVQDNIKPTASNPAPTNVSCLGDIPAPDPAVVTDEADNCGGTPTVTHFGDVNNGGTGAKDDPYIVTREYQVTDGTGNVISVMQEIRAEDTEPPSITCPGSITQSNDVGLCTAVVSYATPTSSDNCGASSVSLISGPASGSAFPVGPTIVIYEATDAVGNTKECSFTVTVNDEDDPVAVCQDITVNLKTFGLYDLNAAELDGGSTDNCGAVGFGINTTIFDCDDVGSTFPIQLTVSDNSGNLDFCTANVTVGDALSNCNQEPVAKCKDIEVNANAACQATITAEQINDGSFDTDGDALTYSLNNFGPFGKGMHMVELTVSDGQLSDKCTAKVTVRDVTAPEKPAAPAPVSGSCASDVPVEITLTAIDACDGPITVSPTTVKIDGSCANKFVITRTWTFTDLSGNSSSVSQTITISDETDPTLTTPPNVTIECDESTLPANTGTATAIDNCDGIVSPDYSDSVTDVQGDNCYTILRTWTAADQCGNSSSKVQKIKVQDTKAPVITFCPANMEVDCDLSIPAVGSPTATDNCDASVSINYLGEVRDNSCGSDYYTLTRSWEAEDNCGNTKLCEQVITVNTRLYDNCFSLALDMSYNATSKTTTFSWSFCVEDSKCQDLSNVHFSLPCGVKKSSDVSNAGSSKSEVVVDFSGKAGQCGRYAIVFENFGDGGIKGEAGACATFYYTLAGDYRNYETDVSVKAGRERGLGFTGVGAVCDCDGSVGSGGNYLANQQHSELLNIQTGIFPDAAKLRAYPNPATHEMTIEFSVPETITAFIELFDMQGRRVARIFEQEVEAGLLYRTRIDRQELQLPQGTYFYRLRAGGHSLQGKVVFLD